MKRGQQLAMIPILKSPSAIVQITIIITVFPPVRDLSLSPVCLVHAPSRLTDSRK